MGCACAFHQSAVAGSFWQEPLVGARRHWMTKSIVGNVLDGSLREPGFQVKYC